MLERYLRQKNGLTAKNNLDNSAMKTLCSLFPSLRDENEARDFWNATRNGLQHWVTFQKINRNGTALTQISVSQDFEFDLKFINRCFELHPEKFCEAVLKAITINFGEYCGVSANTKLPSVTARVRQYQEGKLDRKAVPPGQIALTTSVE